MHEIVLYRQLKDARWHIICRVTILLAEPADFAPHLNLLPLPVGLKKDLRWCDLPKKYAIFENCRAKLQTAIHFEEYPQFATYIQI